MFLVGCALTPYALGLMHWAGCAHAQACVGCAFRLAPAGAAGRGPLLGWVSFCRLGARVSVSVLVHAGLVVRPIFKLRCSCVVGRSQYGSHGAWACGGWAVWLLLNGCGGADGWCRLLFK